MPAAPQSSAHETVFDEMAGSCLGVKARVLSRVISRIYDRALRPTGVKGSQLTVLVAAGKMGLARPQAVCRMLKMDASTLSRNVERLKAKGWLTVVEDEDARAQPFRLTAAGRRVVERAVPAWRQAQAETTALLGEQVVRALSQASEPRARKNPKREPT
jgi:DNA-binding MarR family transcriptional regulator